MNLFKSNWSPLFFVLFLSSFSLSFSSRAGICLNGGIKSYLDYLVDGSFFKSLDSTSPQIISSLENEERLLKALGVENPKSSLLQHASRVFRWVRREERFRGKYKEAKKRRLEALKRILEKEHVIKEEDIPESFFKEQVRLVKERGGDVSEIQSRSGRKRLLETLLGDQRSSLHAWVDYLALDNAHTDTPTWVKLWAIEGMLKLGRYNPETRRFGKRAKNQTAPFAELNREALAMVMGDILKRVELLKLKNRGEVKKRRVRERLKEMEISNKSAPYLEALLSGSFKKIYEESLMIVNKERGDLSVTKGKWIRFPQGSDPEELTKVLDGQGSGWCTAYIGTATGQLSKGDFYIYFSNDFEGNPTIPRIAIRMEEGRIAEIRGRGSNQNLDPEMAETNILKEKLKEFGVDGEKYEVRLAHSKRLSDLEMKTEQDIAFTRDELKFLYEVDEKIEGLGYEEDPRIEEIKDQRDPRADLAFALGLQPHEISITKEEALRGGVKFHYQFLNLSDRKEGKDLQLPERVSGNVTLSNITSGKDLKCPLQVEENLFLDNLTSIEDLELPRQIGGTLYLPKLTSAKGLKLPDQVAHLDLKGLTSAKGLELPPQVDGNIDLRGLNSLESLHFSGSIGGVVYLNLKFYDHPQIEKWERAGIQFDFSF